jgi:uncharacterized damage-inducible protein DinB
MSETARIADEIRRSYVGPAWHGSSLTELLAGIDEAIAVKRPPAGAHSICEIVMHLSAWQNVAHEVIQGQAAPELPFEGDWPAGSDWDAALRELDETARQLCAAIAALSDSRLCDKVEGREYSIYVLLHGIAQHNAYHGGQISLLKKSLGV